MTTEIRKVHNDPVQSADLQHHEVKTKFNTHTAMQADPTSTDTDKEKHVSNAQTKAWQDHIGITGANPHGTLHSQLSTIEQADDTSSNTDGGKHVTNALVKKYEDHRGDSSIHHTLEAIQDNLASFLVEGNAVTLTYDDTANTLTIAVGQDAHIADAKTDYVSIDLDTTAEIVTAFNATNGKINSILAALETVGILATS